MIYWTFHNLHHLIDGLAWLTAVGLVGTFCVAIWEWRGA